MPLEYYGMEIPPGDINVHCASQITICNWTGKGVTHPLPFPDAALTVRYVDGSDAPLVFIHAAGKQIPVGHIDFRTGEFTPIAQTTNTERQK